MSAHGVDRHVRKIGYWKSEKNPDFPDPESLMDRSWPSRDRQIVASYLDSFETAGGPVSYSNCVVCGDHSAVTEGNDGNWAWPSNFSHYVRAHSVRPDAEFLKHVFSSDRAAMLIATAAANELMKKCPGSSASPSLDPDGTPIVQVFVPKGATANHLPDVVEGVQVRRKEMDVPIPYEGAYENPAPEMSPARTAGVLREIADSIDSAEAPSRALIGSKLRLFLAVLEGDVVLVFAPDPGASSEMMASDDGSVQDSVDLELMQAGAKSVEWNDDNLYVVVPPGAKVSVMQAFNGMKDGELGDEVAEFLRPMDSAFPDQAPERVGSELERIAARIARRKKPKPVSKAPSKPVVTRDMLVPSTEYSCQVELSLTADFEGSVSRQKLLKKLRTELVAAIKAGVTVTAREYGLEPTGVHVKPIKVECAVNDMGTPEEEGF